MCSLELVRVRKNYFSISVLLDIRYPRLQPHWYLQHEQNTILKEKEKRTKLYWSLWHFSLYLSLQVFITLIWRKSSWFQLNVFSKQAVINEYLLGSNSYGNPQDLSLSQQEWNNSANWFSITSAHGNKTFFKRLLLRSSVMQPAFVGIRCITILQLFIR